MMSLSSVVRDRRKALGLSLGELGRRCGVPKQSIYSIESGRSKNPTVNTICGIAAGLQLSAVALFREAMNESGGMTDE